MSTGAKRIGAVIPGNNTVKLTAVLRRRVERAMALEGFTVWSEFCRVALTEKCHHAEDALRLRDPEEYARTNALRSD